MILSSTIGMSQKNYFSCLIYVHYSISLDITFSRKLKTKKDLLKLLIFTYSLKRLCGQTLSDTHCCFTMIFLTIHYRLVKKNSIYFSLKLWAFSYINLQNSLSQDYLLKVTTIQPDLLSYPYLEEIIMVKVGAGIPRHVR